jgi:hypothetical protein
LAVATKTARLAGYFSLADCSSLNRKLTATDRRKPAIHDRSSAVHSPPVSFQRKAFLHTITQQYQLTEQVEKLTTMASI